MTKLKPGLFVAGLVLLASCNRLPSSLRADIASENNHLDRVQKEVQHSRETLQSDLSKAPALFGATSVPAKWTATLQADQQDLDSAKRIQEELTDLARQNHSSSRGQAKHLLTQERQLLDTAERESQSVVAAVTKWVDFDHDLPSHLNQLRREYATVSDFDLAPITKEVEQAAHDWPEKKATLDARLNELRAIPKQAQAQWNASEAARTAASGKLNGAQLATLIETDDTLARDAHLLSANSAELHDLTGQLYNSWDKILTDLEKPDQDPDHTYRERIRTVRTHLADVAAKKTETTSEEHWVDVSPTEFHSVQNDLGMDIAHKDAGLFDYEAQTTPQPPGYAYIAPESQGSNQYGYWDHTGGHSVWAWLPQYLILHELLSNHGRQPIVLDDYRAYRTAQSAGRTYYGQTTPEAPPKYGTHGTFTQTRYADSRYAQHGGFSSSAYASHPGAAATAVNKEHPSSSFDSAGRRFGSGVRPSSGRRFGSFGGSRSFGRGFGRRR